MLLHFTKEYFFVTFKRAHTQTHTCTSGTTIFHEPELADAEG